MTVVKTMIKTYLRSKVGFVRTCSRETPLYIFDSPLINGKVSSPPPPPNVRTLNWFCCYIHHTSRPHTLLPTIAFNLSLLSFLTQLMSVHFKQQVTYCLILNYYLLAQVVLRALPLFPWHFPIILSIYWDSLSNVCSPHPHTIGI